MANKDTELKVRVSGGMKRRMERYAEARDQTVSEVARIAIRNYLEMHEAAAITAHRSATPATYGAITPRLQSLSGTSQGVVSKH